jgi:hypothetical protein
LSSELSFGRLLKSLVIARGVVGQGGDADRNAATFRGFVATSFASRRCQAANAASVAGRTESAVVRVTRCLVNGEFAGAEPTAVAGTAYRNVIVAEVASAVVTTEWVLSRPYGSGIEPRPRR